MENRGINKNCAVQSNTNRFPGRNAETAFKCYHSNVDTRSEFQIYGNEQKPETYSHAIDSHNQDVFGAIADEG